MSEIQFVEQPTPVDLPSASRRKFYLKADGNWYGLDSAGVETQLTGVGGGYTAFVVGKDVGDPYSTIQSAVDAANAEYLSTARTQQIHVKPGSYAEDITWREGISISGVHGIGDIDPLTAAAFPGTATISGNHTVAFPGGVGYFSFQGLRLARKSVGTPLFSWAGSTGSAVSFEDCVFDDAGGAPGGVPYFEAVGAGSGDILLFNRCSLLSNTTGAQIRVDGDSIILLWHDGKYWADLAGSAGIVVENSGGALSPASFIAEGGRGFNTYLDVRDDCNAEMTGVQFRNNFGAAALLAAAAASVEVVDSRLVSVGGGDIVDGSGTVRVVRSVILGSIASTISIDAGAPLEAVSVRGRTETVSTGPGPVALSLLTDRVHVDSTTIAGPVTITLPNPSKCAGRKISIVDVGTGNGSSPYPITVNSAAGSVVGQVKLQGKGAAVTYHCDGTDWYALHSNQRGPSQYLVGQSEHEPFTTIQSALDAAAVHAADTGRAQTVYVLPGTYSEDLTFYDRVNLVGLVSADGPLSTNRTFEHEVLVVGNHGWTATGRIRATIQNIVFEVSALATSGFTWGGGAGTGTCVQRFQECTFRHPGVATAPLIDGTARDIASTETIEFDRCYFRGNRAGYIIDCEGGNTEWHFTDCRVLNAGLHQNTMRIHDTAGAGNVSALLRGGYYQHLTVTDAGTICRLSGPTIIEGVTGSHSPVVVGAGAIFQQSSPLVLRTNGHNEGVSGGGTFRVGGPLTMNPAARISSSTTVEFQQTIAPASIAGGIDAITASGAGPYLVRRDASFVNVDPTGSAGTAVVRLPDPSLRPGTTITVFDSGSAAAANNVTIDSAVGTVVGTASLSANTQRLTYRSDGGTQWVCIGNET